MGGRGRMFKRVCEKINTSKCDQQVFFPQAEKSGGRKNQKCIERTKTVLSWASRGLKFAWQFWFKHWWTLMIYVVIAPKSLTAEPVRQSANDKQARRMWSLWETKPLFSRRSHITRWIQARQEYCLFSAAVRVHNLMMKGTPGPKGALKLEWTFGCRSF